MKAMILAAGRGERMRPLTDHCPKPLLAVAGKPLIVHHIERLRAAGFTELIINHAWLGEQLEAALGDGQRYGVHIQWSPEREALETGGGIYQALPLLGTAEFVIVNGDIWTDYPLAQLRAAPHALAHLVMVPNPPQHPAGDFCLQDGVLGCHGEPRYTYSGLGVFHADLFKHCKPGKFALGPLLRAAMAQSHIHGELYQGRWFDIGTPERLATLDRKLRENAH